MKPLRLKFHSLFALLSTCLLLNNSGCGSTVKNTSAFNLSGNVTGLAGTLILQNAGLDLKITGDGPFTFAASLEDGTAYNVTISGQPNNQACSIANGTGSVIGSEITNIAISCVNTTSYTLGGSVQGLSGTLNLQNNAGETLTLTSDGPFTFISEIADAANYAVTVSVQPTNQTCTVADGSGTISGASVTKIAVTCSTNSAVSNYNIGGTISGLTGTIVLQNNSGNDLTLTSNGSFTFSTPMTGTAAYAITVLSQPSGQTCNLTNASGNVGNANVSNIGINCSTIPSYTVGGTVSGLTGTLVLQNNAGDDLSISANGSFTFATSVISNGTYSVTTLSQPIGYFCTLTNASGTISANITNLAVSCVVAKKIKLSSVTTSGLLGGTAAAAITAADAICGAGYKALIASSARNTTTDWPLAANTAYVQENGLKLISTTDSNGIFTFSLTNSFSSTTAVAWTGLNSTWAISNNCTNWTTGSYGVTGVVGHSSLKTTSAINYNTYGCGSHYSLYCVEQ